MFFLAADAESHVVDHTLIEIGGVPIVTTHMVTLILSALLALWVLMKATKAIETGPESEGNERYITKGRLGQLVEMIVVYLRDEMLRPVLGEKTTRIYLPYLLTLFFFVLACNLVGMIPLLDLQHLIGSFAGNSHFAVVGGTATSNLAITIGLAFISFLVIQFHAFRELGVSGWAHHLLGGAPWWLFPIMVPVELAGHVIKPAALAIRLFANMVAGHTLLATLILFGYSYAKTGMGMVGVSGITVASGLFAFLISFLELFVAVLQAFIFMFLTAVFISLMSHHDDHGHEEHAEGQPARA